jgi:hypothetical protein
MAGMEGLGRLFNIVPAAAGLYIQAQHCSAITFICTSAGTGSAFNFAEAKTSSGGSVQDLGAVIDHYYQATDVDGSVAWTKQTQAAADETGTITAGYVIAVTIECSKVDDGFTYVSCTDANAQSGTVIAILHDLLQQRTPANLAIPGE